MSSGGRAHFPVRRSGTPGDQPLRPTTQILTSHSYHLPPIQSWSQSQPLLSLKHGSERKQEAASS